MTATTANAVAPLTPEQVEQLLVRPVLAASIATQDGVTCSVVRIDGKEVRFPVVTQHPQAAWVAEGVEVPVSDMLTDEVNAAPSKVASLTVITRELADDSSPAAAQVVGQGLARNIARKLDAAFLGNVAAPAPAGLGSLAAGTAAHQVQDIAAGTTVTNLDVFEQAITLAENEGAAVPRSSRTRPTRWR
jgi:HK97 family phage major capsid protein